MIINYVFMIMIITANTQKNKKNKKQLVNSGLKLNFSAGN
jgi:hypothetical protein